MRPGACHWNTWLITAEVTNCAVQFVLSINAYTVKGVYIIKQVCVANEYSLII